MFGLQEILIIIGVILGLIFIPRMINPRQVQRRTDPGVRLTGKARMAVAASLVYLALIAAYFKPWQDNQLIFVYVGVGPVALGWLVYWVLSGFKK
jgi:hypothetical protein